MNIVRNKIPYFLVSMIIIAGDQITKYLFEKYLMGVPGGSVNVIGDSLLRFTLAYNTGIAFSIKLGGRLFLSSVSFLASLFIIYLILRTDPVKKLEIWAFTFILGGAVGNLIDRAFYGKVIDFLDCDFPDIIMNRWPIFNIADSSVTTGMILLMIYYLFFEKNEQQNNRSQNEGKENSAQ